MFNLTPRRYWCFLFLHNSDIRCLIISNPQDMARWKLAMDQAICVWQQKLDSLVPRTLCVISEFLMRTHDPLQTLRKKYTEDSIERETAKHSKTTTVEVDGIFQSNIKHLM